ncbi:MAG: hypothetical protein QXH37_08660, partial [Candidatus Bathyarchaeia archaeon]
LIYDEAKTGEETSLSSWNGKLPIKVAIGANVKVVYVNTTIHGFRGKYDDEGFIEYGEGAITTQAVSIQVYGNIYRIVQSEPLTYTFTIATKTVKLSIVTQCTAFPSLLLVGAAIGVIFKKDKDLAVVGEEAPKRYFGFPI